jgi:prepilin-type processing-associated H-X9-DG protein
MKNPPLTDGSRSGRCRVREGGFTILELSAVLVIILVLVGLLSSALNHTKSKVLRISCLENVKQLQTAWQMYTDDNEQRFPLNQSIGGRAISKIPIEKLSTNSWTAGNPRLDVGVAPIRAGTLFPYTRAPEIYRCPQDSSTVMTRPDMARSRSYSISTFLAGDNAGIDPRVKLKESELINPRPDNVLVFMEEHEDSFFKASFVILPKDRLTLASATESSTPSDRHYQGCHLSFADGHVEFWRWYHPKNGNTTTRLSGTTSRELSDQRRLQSCVPLP